MAIFFESERRSVAELAEGRKRTQLEWQKRSKRAEKVVKWKNGKSGKGNRYRGDLGGNIEQGAGEGLGR